MQPVPIWFTRQLLSLERDMYRYAESLLGASSLQFDLKEDLVQETLLRALKSWQVFDPAVLEMRLWLSVMLKRIYIDEWRKKRRNYTKDPEPIFDTLRADEEDTEEDMDRRSIFGAILFLLPLVKERHREAMLSVDLFEVPLQETAQKYGVPVNTVKTWARRGREEIRKLLVEAKFWNPASLPSV